MCCTGDRLMAVHRPFARPARTPHTGCGSCPGARRIGRRAYSPHAHRAAGCRHPSAPEPVLQVVEERAEHPGAPEFRLHVNALDPPDVAVAPIAPLVSDHRLAGHRARRLRRRSRCLWPGPSAWRQRRPRRGPASSSKPSLSRAKLHIEVGNDRRIGQGRFPNPDVHARC